MGDGCANVHSLLPSNRNGASIMERLPRDAQRVYIPPAKRVTCPTLVRGAAELLQLTRYGLYKEVQMMRVMKYKKTSLAVAAALALGSASAVHAEIGLKAGAWDLSFSGNVNGFATWNSCDTSATLVRGGLACNNPPPGGGKEQAIESGLLPSALVFGAKTSQAG